MSTAISNISQFPNKTLQDNYNSTSIYKMLSKNFKNITENTSITNITIFHPAKNQYFPIFPNKIPFKLHI